MQDGDVSPASNGLGRSRYGSTEGPMAPLLPGRVLDLNRRKLMVERHYQGGRYRGLNLYYLSDLFHTLVNCPWWRFYLLFVCAYMAMYAIFAGFYMASGAASRGCITEVEKYWHALWFSVETSAAIGYGHQAPDPDCYTLQLFIAAQVLTSLLMQASLLGLVFARISNSTGRSATIRFSKVLSMYQGQDGLWRLSFRVANMRQHQVLQPEVRMLLLRRQAAHPFISTQPEFLYSELPTEHVGGGKLWLGVPSVVEHRIDERSPLYGLGDLAMRAADMEIIVLLDGVDESTSRAIEARHSYVPSDIKWHHQFDACIQRRRSGKIGVDFSLFDTTQMRPASAPGSGLGSADITPSGSSPALQAEGSGAQPGPRGRLGEPSSSPFGAAAAGPPPA